MRCTALFHGYKRRLQLQELEYDATKNAAYWSLRPVTVFQRALQIGRSQAAWRQIKYSAPDQYLLFAHAGVSFAGWFLSVRLGSGRQLDDLAGPQVRGIIDNFVIYFKVSDTNSVLNTPESAGQAEQLRETLTQLGAAFIKVGQVMPMTLFSDILLLIFPTMIRINSCPPGCVIQARCCTAELYERARKAPGPDSTILRCGGNADHQVLSCSALNLQPVNVFC